MSDQLLDSLLDSAPAPVRRGPQDKTPAGLRVRRIKQHKRGTIPMPAGPSAYTLSGKVIAESSAALLWVALWAFNGVCTVLAWLAVVQALYARLGWLDSISLSNWFQIPIGVILHIAVSSIEQHLWRSLDGVPPGLSLADRAQRMLRDVRTWEAVAVGALDSLTTSRVLLVVLGWLGVVGFGGIVGAALLGVALALVCEPMMRYHGLGLKVLLKGVR